MAASRLQYDEVARRFREWGRSNGQTVVPQPATADELAAAESALGCQFPASYHWFQLEFGAFIHGPLDIYSVKAEGTAAPPIVTINLDEREAGYPPLPPYLIAFSDSGSDLYCFDTRAPNEGEYTVVWWDHEGDETQPLQLAALSFLDWLAAELQERAVEAVEESTVRLDALRSLHLSWLRDWRLSRTD
jgi:hypothetical protein